MCVLSVCLSELLVFLIPNCPRRGCRPICLFVSSSLCSACLDTQFIYGTVLTNEKLGCDCMLLSSTTNLSGSHIERHTNSKWRTPSPTSHMSEKSGCVSNLFLIPNCPRRDSGVVSSCLVISCLVLRCLVLRYVALCCLLWCCLVRSCVVFSCPVLCFVLA